MFLSDFLVHFAGTNSGVHNESSCSSGPDSPHTSKELHLDGSRTPTRAQYLSASCVVFTHYSGDTASVVDEHFSRALNFSNKDSKGESPFSQIKFNIENYYYRERTKLCHKKGNAHAFSTLTDVA